MIFLGLSFEFCSCFLIWLLVCNFALIAGSVDYFDPWSNYHLSPRALWHQSLWMSQLMKSLRRWIGLNILKFVNWLRVIIGIHILFMNHGFMSLFSWVFWLFSYSSGSEQDVFLGFYCFNGFWSDCKFISFFLSLNLVNIAKGMMWSGLLRNVSETKIPMSNFFLSW